MGYLFMPIQMRSDARENLAEYRAARDRAIRWLLSHLNSDGSLGDPAEGWFYYRAPWTFVISGETEAANAVLGWMRRHMITPDGKIEGRQRIVRDAYAYRNSAFIIGAHLATSYDLSHGLMPDLLSWQDPASGAFSNDLMEDGSQSDDMDLPYACGPGFACIITGHLEAARRVYRHLARLYEVQTELPRRFYYTWSRSGQAVVTRFPADRQFWYVVDSQADRVQRWTIGGIAAGFLCRLYLAEPRPEYLALARKYQSFSMCSCEAQFKYAQVCKSSWGSAMLYQITGEEQYLDWTRKMGDWYVSRQNAEGNWHWDPWKTQGDHIHAALEFAMHLNTLIAGLSSRPGACAGRNL
jgi:hypothetical protein